MAATWRASTHAGACTYWLNGEPGGKEVGKEEGAVAAGQHRPQGRCAAQQQDKQPQRASAMVHGQVQPAAEHCTWERLERSLLGHGQCTTRRVPCLVRPASPQALGTLPQPVSPGLTELQQGRGVMGDGGAHKKLAAPRIHGQAVRGAQQDEDA